MTNDTFSATRKRLGLNQRDLAEALGMSPTTIGQYEHGRHEVPRYIRLAMKALWHRLGEQL